MNISAHELIQLFSGLSTWGVRQWLHLKILWFLESLWLDLLEIGKNCGRVKHETITDLKEKLGKPHKGIR